MSKTIIEVKCTDQVLTLTNTPVIASGGVGEDFVSAEFCEKWDDYAPALLFWKKGVDPIPVLPDADGLFLVPAELTGVDGIVYFGAVGYDTDGNRRTSQAISYRLEAGAITEGSELPAPPGDVFDQVMAHYADVKLYVSTRIDEAAKAAEDSYSSAQAAWSAADAAERQAGAAVEAANNAIFQGPLEGRNASDGRILLPTNANFTGKTIVHFVTPYSSQEASSIQLTSPSSVALSGLYSISDSSGGELGPGAFEKGDNVIALLDAEKMTAYILNPRRTKETMDEMGRQIYPRIPASKTVNGTATIALDYAPEDKMILVFVADEASSQMNNFWLEYETAEDGLVQEGYFLCDANDSPVSEYGFYQGDYVVALLTPEDKRATILNPRMTRNVFNVVQGLLDEINALRNAPKAPEIVSYTGDGTSNLRIWFDNTPKVVQIESLSVSGYYDRALLFKDKKIAKVWTFRDGVQNEFVISLGDHVAWEDGLNFVWIEFNSSLASLSGLNTKNTEYVAIGFM